jgi:murein DD-endopeptidase MepM/ murein hydrolase activator NlpD
VLALLSPAGVGLAADRGSTPSGASDATEALRNAGGQQLKAALDSQAAAAGRRGAPGASRAGRSFTLGLDPEATTTVPWRHGADPANLTIPDLPADEISASPAVAGALDGEAPAGTSGAPTEDVRPGVEPTVFAEIAGQPLLLPGPALGVGFHESGSGRALPLHPVGFPAGNLNAPKIELPPAVPGPEYLVMPTRRRAHGATTAVDIRMEHGEPVTSPVDGTIEAVAEYPLYGRYPDQLVEIVPSGRPDLLVRVLHVEGAVVEPGQEVRAAETVIAHTTRQLPFASQIDRYAGEGPHVHIEVLHRPEHMPPEAPPEAPPEPPAEELD